LLAELNRANVSPTAKEFFDHLKKSVALADKASDGERMLIQANEAAANGNPTKQKEILEKLVAAYPNDERAHFTLGGYYFGQQDYKQAISHYKRSTDLDSNYSSAQHSGLRLLPGWKLQRRRSCVQEIHRAYSQRSESI
jgi:uncharacterized protein HemY